MTKEDRIIGNAIWALIWFSIRQLPRDVTLFHVRQAAKQLARKA